MRLLEIHLECADLEASIRFYRSLLPQARLLWDGVDDPQAFLVLPDGTALGLWSTGTRGVHEGQGGSHVHWAMQVKPDELPGIADRLASLGVKPLEWAWKDGARSVYFFDRDGHQGEFMSKDWGRSEPSASTPGQA